VCPNVYVSKAKARIPTVYHDTWSELLYILMGSCVKL